MRAHGAVDQTAVERALRDAEQLAQRREAGHLRWVQQGLQALGTGCWVEAHVFLHGGAGYGVGLWPAGVALAYGLLPVGKKLGEKSRGGLLRLRVRKVGFPTSLRLVFIDWDAVLTGEIYEPDDDLIRRALNTCLASLHIAH